MKLLKVHESKWVFSNFLHQRRGKRGHGDINEGQYGELILSEFCWFCPDNSRNPHLRNGMQ